MKFYVGIAIFVSYFMFAVGAEAQRPSTATSADELELSLPRDVGERVSNFFKFLRSYDIDKAYSELFKGSDLISRDSLLIRLKENTKRAVSVYGNIIGHETVALKQAGTNFIKPTFLALHTKFPMRYEMTFYNSPERGWILTNIRFDDRSELLFDD